MPNVNVNIKGLSQLGDQADWLEHGTEFLDRITTRIAKAIEEASPKGHIPFRGHVRTSTTAQIESSHPGAKALDKGAFIRGVGHKLRFEVEGKTIFTQSVRLPARNYVKKGLRKRNKIVRDEYEQIFNHPPVG